MSTYTPPYQLTDTILRLSTEIAATVKEITVRGNLSAQPQLHRANTSVPFILRWRLSTTA